MVLLTNNTHDQFVLFKTVWIAELSDGSTVVQDDNRPGAEPTGAWDRLRLYLAETKLSIKHFYLRYMDHAEFPCPLNAEGYFYRDAFGAVMGDERGFPMKSIGYVSNGRLYSSKWKVPELLKIESEVRVLDDKLLESCWLRKK